MWPELLVALTRSPTQSSRAPALVSFFFFPWYLSDILLRYPSCLQVSPAGSESARARTRARTHPPLAPAPAGLSLILSPSEAGGAASRNIRMWQVATANNNNCQQAKLQKLTDGSISSQATKNVFFTHCERGEPTPCVIPMCKHLCLHLHPFTFVCLFYVLKLLTQKYAYHV